MLVKGTRAGHPCPTVMTPSVPLDSDKDENSVALHVSYDSVDFLLTGDAETGAEGRMLASGLPLGAEILKVAHHGSEVLLSSRNQGWPSRVRRSDGLFADGGKHGDNRREAR